MNYNNLNRYMYQKRIVLCGINVLEAKQNQKLKNKKKRRYIIRIFI